MWSCWTAITCLVVTFATWTTPQAGHLKGWLIVFGSQRSLEANAEFHGYDLAPYRERCGVAAMSPANLGSPVWLRPDRDSDWFGPCLVVDTASRVDFHHLVYEVGDLAEIPRWLAERWGTKYGLEGEAYFGDCPPVANSVAKAYAPTLVVDERRPVVTYSYYPYPAQVALAACERAVFDGYE